MYEMEIRIVLAICVSLVTSSRNISSQSLSGKLEGAAYRNITSIGEIQCLRKCLVSTKCMSINYQRETLSCQLNSMANENGLTNDTSWKYMEKTDLKDVFPSEGCTQTICPLNHVCVELSSKELKCMLSECINPPEIANASISVYKTGISEQLVYTCNDFYYTLENTSVTCQADGTFTASNFTCQRISCGDPPQINHTTVNIGSSAVYTCNYGYEMLGVGILECGPSGNWSGGSFSCVEIACDAPPVVNDADVIYNGTDVGSSANYTCDYGYTMSGVGSLQCRLGGTWSDVTFSCVQIQCPYPPSRAYAYVTWYSTYVGQYAYYECVFGFFTLEPKYIICQLGGYWSTVPFTCRLLGIFK